MLPVGIEERPLRWIKLFLDRKQKQPSWTNDLETLATLHQNDRLARIAVADYLAKVQGHIKTRLAFRYTNTFLKDINLRYVLTVPAVRCDIAKEATVAAAKHAGMGPSMVVISGIQVPSKVEYRDNADSMCIRARSCSILCSQIWQLQPV